MGGKKAYEPSTSRVDSEVKKQNDTSYRRLAFVRDVWEISRPHWKSDGKKQNLRVTLSDENVSLDFKIHKRADGRFIVECEKYRWVD